MEESIFPSRLIALSSFVRQMKIIEKEKLKVLDYEKLAYWLVNSLIVANFSFSSIY